MKKNLLPLLFCWIPALFLNAQKAGFSVGFLKTWASGDTLETLHDLRFLADGRLLAVGEATFGDNEKGKQAMIFAIDPQTGERESPIFYGSFLDETFRAVAEAADGSWFAVGQSGDRPLIVRFEQNGQKSTPINTEKLPVNSLEHIAPLGNGACLVAASGAGQTLFGWGLRGGFLDDFPIFMEKKFPGTLFGIERAGAGGLWLFGETDQSAKKKGRDVWVWRTDQTGKPVADSWQNHGGNPRFEEKITASAGDKNGQLAIGGTTRDNVDGGLSAWFCGSFEQFNQKNWRETQSSNETQAICTTRKGQHILAVHGSRGRGKTWLQPISEGFSTLEKFDLPTAGGDFEAIRLLELPDGRLILVGNLAGKPAIFSLFLRTKSHEAGPPPLFSIKNIHVLGDSVCRPNERMAFRFSLENTGGTTSPLTVSIEPDDAETVVFQSKNRPFELFSMEKNDSAVVFCGIKTALKNGRTKLRATVSIAGAAVFSTHFELPVRPRPAKPTDRPVFLLPKKGGDRWANRTGNEVAVKFYARENFSKNDCRLIVGADTLPAENLGLRLEKANESSSADPSPTCFIASMTVSLDDGAAEKNYPLVFEWKERGVWKGGATATSVLYKKARPILYVLPVGVPDFSGGLRQTVMDAQRFTDATWAARDGSFFEEIEVDSTFLKNPERASSTEIQSRFAVLERFIDQKSREGSRVEVFFYFSGHGEMKGAHSFLLPTDGLIINPKTLMENYLQDTAAQKFFFLDACRTEGKKDSPTATLPDAPTTGFPDLTIFQSSSGNQKSFECADGGAFTMALCEKLRAAKNRQLTAVELGRWLAGRTYQLAQDCQKSEQNPVFLLPDGVPDLPIFGNKND